MAACGWIWSPPPWKSLEKHPWACSKNGMLSMNPAAMAQVLVLVVIPDGNRFFIRLKNGEPVHLVPGKEREVVEDPTRLDKARLIFGRLQNACVGLLETLSSSKSATLIALIVGFIKEERFDGDMIVLSCALWPVHCINKVVPRACGMRMMIIIYHDRALSKFLFSTQRVDIQIVRHVLLRGHHSLLGW
jgi:hypothetical protein